MSNKNKLPQNVQSEIKKLNKLSEQIKNHEKTLTELKNKYQKQATEYQKSVEGLKKNLAETKESLKKLQKLVNDFYIQLAGRNLSPSSCPDLETLDTNIKKYLEMAEKFEPERIKNKYGIEDNYTGKYLTVSKKNSARGVTCQSACNEIENIINDLENENLEVTEAQEIINEYTQILNASKKGLNQIEKNSSGADDSIENYANIKAALNKQANDIKTFIANGQKQLEEIKRKAPSDDSTIAAIESWVKSLSMKDALTTVAKVVASACVGPVVKYAYHWVVNQYFG